MADKQEKTTLTTPEGRLINSSLFTRDIYTPAKGQPGKPTYKIEIAFKKDDPEVEKMIDIIVGFASTNHKAPADGWLLDIDAKPGEEANLISGLKDGDKYAAKRARDGKPGDAYRGCWFLRASTDFDRNGLSAADGGNGGVAVYDEDLEDILPVAREKVYNGCYGQALLTLNAWTDDDGTAAVNFYLNAFQKRADGEKLVSVADTKSAFKPVGRKTGGDAESKPAGRRTRG